MVVEFSGSIKEDCEDAGSTGMVISTVLLIL
jgi:hypothetical protein